MKISTLLVTVCLMICCASHAFADILLPDDTNAMANGEGGFWRGTATFSASDDTHELKVEVDYVVYEPGKYSGTDPSGGTEYVYAYEVFNTGSAGFAEVSLFSVGLADGAIVHSCGYDANANGSTPGNQVDPSEIAPSWVDPGGSSAKWGFTFGNYINYGEDSVTLIFTSPHAPRWLTGSVQNGGLSATDLIPSPVPEPATMCLLGLGSLGIALLRMRRRRAGRNR